MRTLPLAESRLLREYEARTRVSAKLSEVAKDIFPSGITQDVQFLTPYPAFIERAQDSRKWDADRKEYVDYFGGHGALVLGHSHAEVVGAVQRQAARGMRFGSSQELELEWARHICKMLPGAWKLRFNVTGTESTHLALRPARAYTGKLKALRFATHFHGWHDHFAFSDTRPPAGILQELVDRTIEAFELFVRTLAEKGNFEG
jgi:glutamate-1-semialdehyde 2,1-aminomutase